MKNPDVYIAKLTKADYPVAPFHPHEIFPEFLNTVILDITDEKNAVYSAVREILFHLGFDRQNFGTENWNPFRNFIKEKDKVVLKPNFVKGNHPL